MSLKIVEKVVTAFEQNARLIYCDETNEGIILDPGAEPTALYKMATERGVNLKGIWLTHAHPDHCGGVAALKRLCPVPFYAHSDGRTLRANVVQFMTMFASGAGDMENCPEPDVTLQHEDKLTIGNLEFQALFTPGHSPDHLCFYCKSEKIVFTGDTLFAGCVGRTDLPGGSHSVLMSSLHDVILKLPPETKVYSGHGPATMIKTEMENNPYLKM